MADTFSEKEGSERMEHRERYDPVRTRRVGFISFLFGLAGAFPLYVASSYFEEALGNSNVSVFYLLTFGGVLFILPFLQRILRRFGSASFFLALLFGAIVVQFPLILFPVSLGGTVLLILYFLVVTIAWATLDIILERFSEDKRSGRIRSLHLTAMNIGLLLAPFLSTRLMERFGFPGVFVVSLALFSLLFIASILALAEAEFRPVIRISLFETIRKAFRRADIRRIYAVSFAMEFFYAVMIVYTPIRLRDVGMDWSDIGSVFTVMLLPFVLVQIPLGMLADKRTGEKEFLILALFIAALSTAMVAFIEGLNIALWATILFLTRLGIASIEILRDSYFYKRIDGEDGDLIAFFRTASPVGNIAAAVIAGVWLLFFPLSSIFFLPAIVLFLALIPAFLLEDNTSERDMKVS